MYKKPLGPDPHSYANYHEASIKDLSLTFEIDFNNHILTGYTDYTVEVHISNTQYINLDARGISINRVTSLNTPNSELDLLYTIPENHPVLGFCVRIPILSQYQAQNSIYKFRIYSSTSSLSSGIQWFEPSQTFGKKYPYVYSQFEAILARTFFPCQDTPSVKSPNKLKLKVPSPLVAACSGELINKEESECFIFPYEQSVKYHSFEYIQKMPVPSYLIAFAAGAIERAQIGPRSYVWSEKEILQEAKEEFVDTEIFLKEAEEITNIPYLWGTYDLLMLPKAFPYGGMENPNLTFLSSSLIVGDQSLVDVVAHEISHSWSGNLVTNASWSDFWLNEGFTMYLERLIIGADLGEEARQFHLKIGYEELKKTCIALQDEPEFTKLVPNLCGVDPDDAFSRIPYEKGCLFLFFLENKVGRKELLVWLRIYFKEFSRMSICSNTMKSHFQNHFKNVDDINWDEWFYGVGLPQWSPISFFTFNGEKDKEFTVKKLAKDWIENNGVNAHENDVNWGYNKPNIKDLKWIAMQNMYFLDSLITSGKKINVELIEKMEKIYKFNQSKNVEILIRWILLCLENNYLNIIGFVEEFVSIHGRGVYVKPIYKKLFELVGTKHIAFEKVKNIYEKNRKFYHAVILNFVEDLIAKYN